MLRSNLARLLFGAALLAGAAALHTGEADADARIQLGAGGNIGQCGTANPYFAEAVGLNGGNMVVCQVWNQGGTVTAQCPLGVLSHRARITRRNGITGALTQTVTQSEPPQITWTNMSPSISVSSPPECPGLFITAVSIGKFVN